MKTYSKTLIALKAQKDFAKKEKVFFYASLLNIIIVFIYFLI